MKEALFLLILFTASTICLAESPVVVELKDLYKLTREQRPASMSREERWAQLDAIRNRARPIVSQEFAKLVDGGVTPLARELLNNPETVWFSLSVLCQQFQVYSADTTAVVLAKVFNATPDSLRGSVIRSFVLDLPKEVFAEKEIQEWLVKKINGGIPAGPFYFILTDESAKAVFKTATASMKQFSKTREHNENNLFSLLSAVFLASREDKDALKLLDSLLDKRELDSLFDTAYALQAVAMSGNEKLIQKIRDIITTDKRARSTEGSDPPEISFAQIAASVCSLTIEGFPAVEYWDNYDDDMKKKVHDWLKNNPTHKVKLDDPRVFFCETPFQSIIPALWRAYEKEQERGL